MAPSADRESAGVDAGPVPVGTGHQVSGPWEKIFGPGGLESAVGRRSDGPLTDPLNEEGVVDEDLADDEEESTAGRPRVEPVDASSGAAYTRVEPVETPVETPAGQDLESAEQPDGDPGELQRVPVHQNVAGLDPRDAPRDADPADDTEPDGPDADPESVARTVVLRKLTAQDRTRAELADALRNKDVPEAVSDRVLDRMEEVGLVDDARFAESWVRSRQQRRGMSAMALRRELNSKGVDPELTDAALTQVDPDDEYTAALALAEKKFRPMADLSPDVAKRRLAGALARRGFSSGLVWRVVREVLGEH